MKKFLCADASIHVVTPTAALHQEDCLTLCTNWPEDLQRMNKQRRDTSVCGGEISQPTSEGRRQTKAISQQGVKEKQEIILNHNRSSLLPLQCLSELQHIGFAGGFCCLNSIRGHVTAKMKPKEYTIKYIHTSMYVLTFYIYFLDEDT